MDRWLECATADRVKGGTRLSICEIQPPMDSKSDRIFKACQDSEDRFPTRMKVRDSPLPEAALAAAVEWNQVERVGWMARVAGVESHDDGDVFWTYSDGEFWPGNQVVGAQFTAPLARARVAALLRYHLERRAACNWAIGSATVPPGLGTILRENGFSCRIHCRAMVATLNSQPGALGSVQGVDFQQSDVPVPLQPVTTPRRRAQFDGWVAVGRLRPQRVWYFGAIDSSIPVGTATLFEGERAAGIYDVEVIPSHQGRGIGTRLVREAMDLAGQHGFRTAVLSATAAGHGLYTRLGFRDVGVLSSWRYGRMRQRTL